MRVLNLKIPILKESVAVEKVLRYSMTKVKRILAILGSEIEAVCIDLVDIIKDKYEEITGKYTTRETPKISRPNKLD
jgi:hypothetical protein